MIQLPSSDNHKVDARALRRLYGSTTSSYKFLWTLAILRIIKDKNFSGGAIAVGDIIDRMLEIAQPLLSLFDFSFGRQDMIREHILSLARAVHQEPIRVNVHRDLRRRVPFRWLTPFVTGGGGMTNPQIVKAVAEKFDGENPPPYKFTDRNRKITLHPDWLAYFSDNATVIQEWTYRSWAEFLKDKNPMTLGVINKVLLSEGERSSLEESRVFWRDVMSMSKDHIFCIYSNEKINARDFELDHYVPHSFIGHDHLWNLTPVLPGVNASKNDSLPHERHLEKLIRQHHTALHLHSQHFADKYGRLMAAYREDLMLSDSERLDEQKLSASYNALVPALTTIAKLHKFESGWVYK